MKKIEMTTNFKAQNIHTNEIVNVTKFEVFSVDWKIGTDVCFEFSDGERINEELFNEHYRAIE